MTPQPYTFPSCSTVLVIDGVMAGSVFDLRGLALQLPRGARLYMATSVDIGTANQNVEVYYRQKR